MASGKNFCVRPALGGKRSGVRPCNGAAVARSLQPEAVLVVAELLWVDHLAALLELPLEPADDGTVRMAHVVRGLQRELRKSGKMVDPQQFGDYQDRLRLE